MVSFFKYGKEIRGFAPDRDGGIGFTVEMAIRKKHFGKIFAGPGKRRLVADFKRLLAVLCLVLLGAPLVVRGQAGNVPDLSPTPLELNRPVPRDAQARETRRFSFFLKKGEFARISVRQDGARCRLTLFDGQGKARAEKINGRGTRGLDTLFWIALADEVHQLEVRALSAGRYEAVLEAVRPATPEDGERVAAQKLVEEAIEIFNRQPKQEDLKSAIEKYEGAISRFHSVNERKAEAEAINQKGRIHDQLGDPVEAETCYTLALRIFRDLGDPLGEALALNNLSQIYDVRGETRKAIETLEKVLEIARAQREPVAEAAALNNLGRLYDILGEKRLALRNYREALPLVRAAGAVNYEALTLNNIGAVLDALGEKQAALDIYRQALPLAKRLPDQSVTASVYARMGQIYRQIGEGEKARDLLEQALAIHRQTGNRGAAANLLLGLAGLFDERGSPEDRTRALALLDEAKTLYLAVRDRRGAAQATLQNGLVRFAAGEAAFAEKAFGEALAEWREMKDRNGQVRALNALGQLRISTGNPDEARGSLDEAARTAADIGARQEEARALYWLARLDRDAGEPEKALGRSERALELIETIRSGIAGPDSRAGFTSRAQDYYELKIDLLMRAARLKKDERFVEAAYECAERGRARGLLELVARFKADVTSANPELAQRTAYLEREVVAKTERLTRLKSSNAPPARITEAGLELDAVTAELEKGFEALRASDARYAALTRPPSLSARDIREKAVPPGATLVQFFIGTERSFVWAVRRDALVGREIAGRKTLLDAANRFLNCLRARQPVEGEAPEKRNERIVAADAELDAAGRRVGELLFGPVAEFLTTKQIIVIGADVVAELPLNAAPVPNGKDVRPLVADHEVLVAPSATFFEQLRRESSPASGKGMLIVADPVFGRSDSRFQGNRGSSGPAPEKDESDVFPRLVFTRREAAAIAGLAGGIPVRRDFGFDASRDALLKTPLDGFRYLHFATHGVTDENRPELSGIVLSRIGPDGEPREGVLRLPEIANLKLSARLVVLSACRTGTGRELRGEGVIGLSRGFFQAGAAAVLVSQWNVDDAATADFMALFYAGMFGPKKLTPAAALREAQLQFQRNPARRAPYYWAAFVLHGNGG